MKRFSGEISQASVCRQVVWVPVLVLWRKEANFEQGPTWVNVHYTATYRRINNTSMIEDRRRNIMPIILFKHIASLHLR